MNAARKTNPAAELLPPKLAELVEEIGFPATLKLVEKWGGIRLYVPLEGRLSSEHPIAKELGLDVALKLARTHSEWLEVPRAARYLRGVRDKIIREAYDETSITRLARRFGMTRRNVFYIVGRDAPDESAQQDLFGE